MVKFCSCWCGAVAQLGARLDGIEEVVGSNPIGSTNFSSKNFPNNLFPFLNFLLFPFFHSVNSFFL